MQGAQFTAKRLLFAAARSSKSSVALCGKYDGATQKWPKFLPNLL